MPFALACVSWEQTSFLTAISQQNSKSHFTDEETGSKRYLSEVTHSELNQDSVSKAYLLDVVHRFFLYGKYCALGHLHRASIQDHKDKTLKIP